MGERKLVNKIVLSAIINIYLASVFLLMNSSLCEFFFPPSYSLISSLVN